MTEDHAKRVRESMTEAAGEMYAAINKSDARAARKAFQVVTRIADAAITESIRGRIEADSLATELEKYRPVRSQKPPAPDLRGYCYVTTSKAWVCVAVEVCEMVWIAMGGYSQEHCAPERKTLCGNATGYPFHERFSVGGWPRMHETCPECMRALVAKGLIGSGTKEVQCGLFGESA